MLSAKDREEIKFLMEEQIQELEEKLRRHREAEPIAPDVAIGRLSRLDSMVNKQTLDMAMADAEKKLNRLRDKLSRINSDDFGKCGRCGKDIPIERLRVAPDRWTCMACIRELKPK